MALELHTQLAREYHRLMTQLGDPNVDDEYLAKAEREMFAPDVIKVVNRSKVANDLDILCGKLSNVRSKYAPWQFSEIKHLKQHLKKSDVTMSFTWRCTKVDSNSEHSVLVILSFGDGKITAINEVFNRTDKLWPNLTYVMDSSNVTISGYDKNIDDVNCSKIALHKDGSLIFTFIVDEAADSTLESDSSSHIVFAILSLAEGAVTDVYQVDNLCNVTLGDVTNPDGSE